MQRSSMRLLQSFKSKCMSDQFAPHPIAVITGDVISAFAVGGTLMGYLPDIAALAALVWYSVEIYESKTAARFTNWVRSWLR